MLTGQVASSCPLGAVSEYSLQGHTGRDAFRGATGSSSPSHFNLAQVWVGEGSGESRKNGALERKKGRAGAVLMWTLVLQPAPSRQPALLRAKRLGLLTANIFPSFTTNNRSVQRDEKQPVDVTSGSKRVMQRLKTQRLPNTQPCPPHPGRAGMEQKPRG